MQGCPAHAAPWAGTEFSVDVPVAIQIADAVQLPARWRNTETLQLLHRVRHQAFAAGLVDGSAAPFDDDHLEPCPCAVQCGGQPGGATTSDEQVDHVRLASAAFSTLIRVRSSAALSTENTSVVTHAECTNGSATPSATTAT